MDEVVKYWLETAAHDYETMEALLKTARYSDALFFGHIILEKAFKALIVKRTKEHAPYVHNLLQLQAISGIPLNEDDLNLLVEVNDFNIRARYPEQKLAFYKQATEEFTGGYMTRITNLYKKLCQTVKS
ncbi:HEPN domain-containing protein [Patescibacteria group bacterium]|nr:HEPN domain-containing protein [Patescibacteria group bacterium]MDE1946835.1 HEPN domain-containing protein [Patescibacteria group bacterium]MDE2010655.1 HEPN domain-containing protein [Patescibacteria group bacterium]MDE2232739.1 HEPN domain-containing protein [Patescibacteria group bacterium]